MICLRPAVKADTRSLFELDQICFPAGIAYSLPDFRALLRSRRVLAVVAEDQAILAGFAMAQIVMLDGLRTGLLVTIDVAPQYRRLGVGHRLLSAIEAAARSAEAKRLRLEVAVNNLPAQSFYTRLGFNAIGEIPNYYAGNLDAIVMEKRLAEAGISPDDRPVPDSSGLGLF
jgi:ribosomal-protein-alanine N-acetyltransferase